MQSKREIFNGGEGEELDRVEIYEWEVVCRRHQNEYIHDLNKRKGTKQQFQTTEL